MYCRNPLADDKENAKCVRQVLFSYPILLSWLAFLQSSFPCVKAVVQLGWFSPKRLPIDILYTLPLLKTKSPSSAGKHYAFSAWLRRKLHSVFWTAEKTSIYDTELSASASRYIFKKIYVGFFCLAAMVIGVLQKRRNCLWLQSTDG